MRVLLTNDDGIFAPGLCALYWAFCEKHEVYIVAPDSERSAVGHAITLSDPLRVKKVRYGRKFWGWAVSGTPADCVKLAVLELLPKPIDMVVSGINQGANVGINILYSGTVSAATEGAIYGKLAIAISLDSYVSQDFCYAAHFAERISNWLMQHDLQGIALNINVPAIPANKIKGVKFVRQGTYRFDEKFDKRIDPRGNVYYWQVAEKMKENGPKEGTDIHELKRKFITVTPITYNLTSKSILNRFQNKDQIIIE